jgi:hypothetical protein
MWGLAINFTLSLRQGTRTHAQFSAYLHALTFEEKKHVKVLYCPMTYSLALLEASHALTPSPSVMSSFEDEKECGEPPSQCHFVHHKSHTD